MLVADPTGLTESVQYGFQLRLGACLAAGAHAGVGAVFGGFVAETWAGGGSYNPVHEILGGCVAGAAAPGFAAAGGAVVEIEGQVFALQLYALGGFVGAFLDSAVDVGKMP
jgi:hypothetical protein